MTQRPPDLPTTIEDCHEWIIQLFAENIRLENDLLKVRLNVDILKQRLREFARSKFGKSSEKADIQQLSIFAQEVVADMLKSNIETESKEVEGSCNDSEEDEGPVRATKKPHGGKKPLPETLPRERREYRLSEEERACPCGCLMKEIGVEISNQLEYVPAKLTIIEHVQYKYACTKNLEGVKTAAKPAQPMAYGLAGPGLLAHIIEDKHLNHLPLYRQEQIFKRLGHPVPRSSMARWLKYVAEQFKDILLKMKEVILESQVIHADETPLKFIDRDKPRGKTRQGYLWTYYGDDKHPYVIFSFKASRAAEAPVLFLGEYPGYLITDGYVAYEILAEKGKITLACCHAHARRGFEKSLNSYEKDASYALAIYARLYEIEARAKNCTDEERLEMRKKESVPILNNFHSWLIEKQKTALPKTSFGKAVSYCLNRWESLTRYTLAGCLKIDNNPVENAIRPIAVGRKNWLFCASEEGGDTAAALATIVNTCKRLGVRPYDYIQDVLVRLANGETNIDELLPDRWQQNLTSIS